MRRTSEGADGALRPRLWGIFARLLLFVLSTNVFGAANSGITVQVSRETAPPGGYAQFKVSLNAPALVSQASISMSFDSKIFGPVASVAAFSATGDQTGQSHLEGQKVGAAYLFRP